MNELYQIFQGLTVMLFLTAFIKILTSLSILRLGLGLNGVGFGVVVIGLSFVFSMLVMTSHFEGEGLSEDFLLSSTQNLSVSETEARFRPFLEKNTDVRVLDRLVGVKKRLVSNSTQHGSGGSQASGEKSVEQTGSFSTLVAAFLVSELREAFQIGFLILLPFLLIDLIVVNVLMLLQINQIKASVISLPIKLILFISVDAWTLITEKLLGAYV